MRAYCPPPFLTARSIPIDVNGNGADPPSRIAFCIPAGTGFGLAASVCLRRKNFRRSGFAVQLAGIALMAPMLAADALAGRFR